MDKPRVYAGTGRSALDRFFYTVPNESSCESDPVSNCTAPGRYCTRVNLAQLRRTLIRVDGTQMESNLTDLL